MKFLLRLVVACVLYGLCVAAPAKASIAGDWNAVINGVTLDMSLGDDGNGTLNGAPIQWQTMGSLLFIQKDGAVITYVFATQGDKLQVSGGDLAAPILLAPGKPKAVPKTGNSANKAATKKGAGSAAAGKSAELVGKWCKGSVFNANGGGGSSSMSCFELNADGSYSYASEGSMSAYSSGMYGGTASQSGDSGRWSVSGTTITARSANGTVSTYQLEKKNHPKNRDPMICLDGDCYVTYYNKAPW